MDHGEAGIPKQRLERSEGGGSFYAQVELELETYDGRRITARAFKGAPTLECRERPPSRRYLGLLQSGARASELDPEYCAGLDGLPHAPDSALVRSCGAAFVRAFMWMSQGRGKGFAQRYVRLLQETDRVLPPLARHGVQLGMIAPGVALGLALRRWERRVGEGR